MNHERNGNQNHDEGLLHAHKKTYYTSNNPQEVTSFRENVGKSKSEPLFTTGKNNGGTTSVRHHWVAATPQRFF